MPYIQRASYFPEYGKVAEVQAVVEARVRAVQAEGRRATLTQTVIGLDMPSFHSIIVYEDLEEFQQRNEAAAEAQAQLRANLVPLVRKPSVATLNEVFVSNPRPAPAGGYILWTTREPLPDKIGELAALSAEWCRTRNSQGYRFAVGTIVAGPNAGASPMAVSFDRLSELQELRERARTEEASQKFQRDSGALLSGPPIQEILRSVITTTPRDG